MIITGDFTGEYPSLLENDYKQLYSTDYNVIHTLGKDANLQSSQLHGSKIATVANGFTLGTWADDPYVYDPGSFTDPIQLYIDGKKKGLGDIFYPETSRDPTNSPVDAPDGTLYFDLSEPKNIVEIRIYSLNIKDYTLEYQVEAGGSYSTGYYSGRLLGGMPSIISLPIRTKARFFKFKVIDYWGATHGGLFHIRFYGDNDFSVSVKDTVTNQAKSYADFTGTLGNYTLTYTSTYTSDGSPYSIERNVTRADRVVTISNQIPAKNYAYGVNLPAINLNNHFNNADNYELTFDPGYVATITPGVNQITYLTIYKHSGTGGVPRIITIKATNTLGYEATMTIQTTWYNAGARTATALPIIYSDGATLQNIDLETNYFTGDELKFTITSTRNPPDVSIGNLTGILSITAPASVVFDITDTYTLSVTDMMGDIITDTFDINTVNPVAPTLRGDNPVLLYKRDSGEDVYTEEGYITGTGNYAHVTTTIPTPNYVVNTVKSEDITYNFTNSITGTPITLTRYIYYIYDTTPPNIIPDPSGTIYIETDSAFSLGIGGQATATATDTIDTVLLGKPVNVSGTIYDSDEFNGGHGGHTFDTAGSDYKIKYVAFDSSGNRKEVEQDLLVRDPITPLTPYTYYTLVLLSSAEELSSGANTLDLMTLFSSFSGDILTFSSREILNTVDPIIAGNPTTSIISNIAIDNATNILSYKTNSPGTAEIELTASSTLTGWTANQNVNFVVTNPDFAFEITLEDGSKEQIISPKTYDVGDPLPPFLISGQPLLIKDNAMNMLLTRTDSSGVYDPRPEWNHPPWAAMGAPTTNLISGTLPSPGDATIQSAFEVEYSYTFTNGYESLTKVINVSAISGNPVPTILPFLQPERTDSATHSISIADKITFTDDSANLTISVSTDEAGVSINLKQLTTTGTSMIFNSPRTAGWDANLNIELSNYASVPDHLITITITAISSNEPSLPTTQDLQFVYSTLTAVSPRPTFELGNDLSVDMRDVFLNEISTDVFTSFLLSRDVVLDTSTLTSVSRSADTLTFTLATNPDGTTSSITRVTPTIYRNTIGLGNPFDVIWLRPERNDTALPGQVHTNTTNFNLKHYITKGSTHSVYALSGSALAPVAGVSNDITVPSPDGIVSFNSIVNVGTLDLIVTITDIFAIDTVITISMTFIATPTLTSSANWTGTVSTPETINLSSIFTGAATYEIVGVVSNTALIGTPELQRNDGTPDTSGNKLSITPVSNMVGTSEITIKAKTTGTDFAFLTHTFTFTIPNPPPRKKVGITLPNVNAGDEIDLAGYIEGVSETNQPGGTADVLSIDAILTNLTNGNVLKHSTHPTKVVFDTISAASSIDDTFTVTVSDGSNSANLQFSIHLLVAAANDYSPFWWKIRDKHTVDNTDPPITNPKYSQLGNYETGTNNKIEFGLTGDGVFDESTHKVALGHTKLTIGKSFIVKVKHMGQGSDLSRRHLMTWGLTTRIDVPNGKVFPWTTTSANSGAPLYNGANDMFIQNWWTPTVAGDAQNPYYANVIGSSTGIAAPPGMKDGEASLSYPTFVNYTSKNKNAAANSSATSPVSSIKNFHVPGSSVAPNPVPTYENNDWIKFTRVSDTVFTWYLWKPSDATPSWVPQHTWNPTSGDNFRLMWSTFDLFGAVYYIGET